MDVGSAVRLLLRRWWVLVIGLVLTLGATAYLYTQSPPNYQAQGRMLLLLPANARPTEGPGSPFLYLPNGLQVLAGMVIAGPSSREYHQAVAASGLTSQYELDVDIGSPIISISVEGTDPQNVIATRDRVIKGVRDELARIQREEKTPARQTASARLYGTEATPDLVQGNRTRGLLVALGIGALVTLLATFIVDRAIAIVRNRRAKGSPTPGGSPDSQGSDQSDDQVRDETSREASSGAGQSQDGKSQDEGKTGEPEPSSLARA